MHIRRRIQLAVAVALTLGAIAIGFTLSQSPIVVLAVNTSQFVPISSTRTVTSVCQADETLPRETSSLRLRIFAPLGPRVTVSLSTGGRIIARGEQAAGWTGGVVTVPVKPLRATQFDVELCFKLFLKGHEAVTLSGAPGELRLIGDRVKTDPPRVRIEYLRRARSSWWSLAPEVARRMGLGHAAPGTGGALFVLLAMIAVIVVATLLLLRELSGNPAKGECSDHRSGSWVWRLPRRVPSAAWVCAALACANAVSWSIITPPFNSPDEPEHIAYVKQLAETGRLPIQLGEASAEELVALEGVHQQRVAEQPENQTISSRAEQSKLEKELTQASGLPRKGSESAGVAASQPPLYYALESVPYRLGASGTLLDRVELMRLFSALMGGITALFTFLFVREVLPRVRWAWTVGGISVAVVPLLGFMSGVVNPDAMLYSVTAAVFYWLARGFRRGQQRGDALMLGLMIAVGWVTKLNFVAIAPGALLGLIVLGLRAGRTLGRRGYVSLAMALAVALTPVVLDVAVNLLSYTTKFGAAPAAIDGIRGPAWAELSYIWQLYLPRLPGMPVDFAGLVSTRAIWFRGYVGLYGWLDTTFPAWIYDFALLPAALIFGLSVRFAIVRFAALRGRVAELLVYGAICVGLLLVVGASSYLRFPEATAEFGQFRYLLPLIPLLGVVLAMAARAAGRRWGPVVGVAIVMLFVAHDIASQLQVIARFYG